MEQSRYRDKAYLVTYELTTDLFESFGVKVEDIVPARSVFILYTDRGVKILKKISCSVEELEFINSVVNHAMSGGYRYVVPFMRTREGRYYIEKDGSIYVMLDLIEGREADFQNPLDIGEVAKSLCLLHRATSGFSGVIESRNNLFRWIPKFKRRAENLLKFKEIAGMHEIRSGFDQLFLENADRYYRQASSAVDLLRQAGYQELCDDSGTACICHHDLAYHNIIVASDGCVYFVDFDLCILDLRIHDIANLIVKAVKHGGWNIEKAKAVIDGYSAVDTLDAKELQTLHAFLTFPQDFYEISRQYYMRTKRWDEDDFLGRLQRKAGYYDDRERMLLNFKDLFL